MNVNQNSPRALKEAVAIGPVAVAVESDNTPFMFYNGGILDAPYECGSELDHAVIIVGYGTANHTDYWLVKNSWGDKWGEHGFIRIKVDWTEGAPG